MINNLINANAIPFTLAQNKCLLAVLLNEIILETLKNLHVPEFPDENDFYDPYNSLLRKYEDKRHDLILAVEEDTGVHLNLYHTALTYLGKYKTARDKNIISLSKSS